MKMQKFLDWCADNPQSSRDEWVAQFKKMGWTEGAKFSAWHCHNRDHPAAKKFVFILNTPKTTHPECWDE